MAPVIATSVLAAQQLLIMVVNVMLHAQLYFLFDFFSRKSKHQTCLIFECISGGGRIEFLLLCP